MGKNNESGAWGERLAASYLRRRFYRIIETGYRSRFGEIDIIAKHGKYLVFVEVKLRKSAKFAEAKEYVDTAKQQRLIQTAAMYLSQFPTEQFTRFDVIEIYAPDGIETKRPIINHLEDAFQ